MIGLTGFGPPPSGKGFKVMDRIHAGYCTARAKNSDFANKIVVNYVIVVNNKNCSKKILSLTNRKKIIRSRYLLQQWFTVAADLLIFLWVFIVLKDRSDETGDNYIALTVSRRGFVEL